MCRRTTLGLSLRLAVVGLLTLSSASAQSGFDLPRPAWRHVGSTSVELGLAAPVTGPVDAVWFSPDGQTIFVQTHSGFVFESADLELWKPAPAAKPPVTPDRISTSVLPPASDRGALIRAHPADARRLYALGSHLYRSDDSGGSWTNLTDFAGESIIGSGLKDLAVSTSDPDQLVVANEFGIWRSMDGGLSWTGLNQELPNLPVRRILSTPASGDRLMVLLDGLGVVEWAPGHHQSWLPARRPAAEQLDQAKRQVSAALGVQITALASSADRMYAGAADGRIWISNDHGRTWPAIPSFNSGGAPVEMIWVDSQEPSAAVAVLGAAQNSRIHVVRTFNGGVIWDDVTGDLPDAAAHSVTADRKANAVYVATDWGVFVARVPLDSSAPASPWTLLSANLPAAPAMDVRLDSTGNMLYVALSGHGIYSTPAPHHAHSLRIVNAADFSVRPAAPGSLLSVLGGTVNRAQAGNLTFPVLAASDAESQIQVPFEAAGPSLSLALDTTTGRFTFGLPVQNVAPAIFVDRDGIPMLLDADTGLMLNAGNTARSGSRIQILAAGLGRVRPAWPTGLAAPLADPPKVEARIQAFLDGQSVPVIQATLAPGYIGFYLVEIQLPAIVNYGPAELYLTGEGRESNRVRVYLQP